MTGERIADEVDDDPSTWPRRRFLLAIAAILVAQATTSFDNAGITILVRPIQIDLGTTLTSVQYGVSGQLLFGAATVMVASRLGELFGRTRILMVGLVIRAIGAIITAAAPNALVFFIGRAACGGIGTALALVSGMAILGVRFAGPPRARASALIVGAVAVSTIAAPLLAGGFAGSIGWRWFYVICVCMWVVGIALVRYAPNIAASAASERVDLGGALLAVLAFGCLVFGIQQCTQWGLFEARNPPFTIADHSPSPFLIVIGLLLLGCFAWYEHTRRVAGRSILFDIRLLRDRYVRNAHITLSAIGAVLFGVTFLVPLYLQVVQGLSPFEASLRTVAYGVGALVMSLGVARIVATRVLRWINLTCIALLAVGLVLVAWEIGPIPWGAVPAGMFALGLGLSLSKGPMSVATQRAVPVEERGYVTAMSESAWAIGGALGVAVVGTIMLSTLTAGVLDLVRSDARLSTQAQEVVQYHADQGIPLVSISRVQTVLEDAGLPSAEVDTLVDHYASATNDALLWALAGAAIMLVIAIVSALRLPKADPYADPAQAPPDRST